ncbi:mitochondrial carrier [Atractiella rhizophila]|nr:mitochondrial carrier [Atractiella rhizophila]
MSEQRTNAALKDISYGSAAGMISKVFEHPFDLVKVRLQSQPLDATGKETFRGPVDCAIRTVKHEGFRGLYRGLSMPVLGAMLENATLFFVYRSSLALLAPQASSSTNPPIGPLLVSSALAGCSASFVLTPVELIKCRLQVQMLQPALSLASAPGPVEMFQGVLRDHGVRGLWLGQTGTLIRETGGGMAWFTVFSYSKAFFQSRHSSPQTPLSTPELLTSGALAGVAYNVSFFPADCIKSAIQTEEENGLKKSTFWGKAREIWKVRGVRGFYAGMGVTIARSAPSSAIIWWVYERLERRFG